MSTNKTEVAQNKLAIHIPLEASEYQEEIRKSVLLKFDNQDKPAFQLEKEIGVSQLKAWLDRKRLYSFEKAIQVAQYFDIPVNININGQTFALYTQKQS